MVTVLTRRGAEGQAGEMPSAPDPDVPEQAKRRRCTAADKARSLAAADACSAPGPLGPRRRREGRYAAHLRTWRRQRQAGPLAALAPQRRGRQGPPPVEPERPRLKRANARLAPRLAEAVIEVQKKLSALLDIPVPDDEREASSCGRRSRLWHRPWVSGQPARRWG